MDKQEIRQLAKKLPWLNEKQYTNASNAILLNLIDVPEFQHAKRVFVYISKYPEPCTRDIIAFCFMSKKKVYVPIIRDGEMYISELKMDDDYVVASYGIKEPVNAVKSLDVPDVAIVPMVAFDDQKNRLGHGKGYYDRYLKDKDMYKIGICFSRYGIPNLPIDENDVPMDMIITEAGYIL